MRVLLSAYRCEPAKGSEPGVGWNWALQLARFHEVWVLTRKSNRMAIEQELSCNPVPNLHFVYYESPSWQSSLTFGVHHLHYVAWQLGAIKVAKELHQRLRFDLCHHVTYAAHRFPSLLAWLDIPFIWGPVGGGERAPFHLYFEMGARGFALELLRSLHNFWVRFDPLVCFTRARATLILATTEQTAKALGGTSCDRVRVFPTIGMEFRPQNMVRTVNPEAVRVLYVGNLLHWKGVSLAIKAFAIFRSRFPQATFNVIGNGRDRARLNQLVSNLGLNDSVKFLGQLTRQQTLEHYHAHDIFLYPSMHDSGAMVVLEAMAAQMPVICLDLGGPGLSITDECGMKISARSPSQVISGLSDALCRLADNPNLRRQMGEAGRRRAMEIYDWNRKGEQLMLLYSEVATNAAEKKLMQIT